MKRYLIVGYGAAAYLLFLAAFLYLVGFVSNIWVPRSVDRGVPAPIGQAVLHAAGQPAQRPNLRPGGLTPREIEVLCLVARGASNREIAKSLVISEKTARNHVERTYAKIGVSNRIGASMYALRNGLVNNA